MVRLLRAVALALLCDLVLGAPGFAQAQTQPQVGPAKPWSLRGGIGLMDDPDAFLMNFEIERYMRDEVTVGFALQLGVDDDYTVVSPMVFARYVFDQMRTLGLDALRRIDVTEAPGCVAGFEATGPIEHPRKACELTMNTAIHRMDE